MDKDTPKELKVRMPNDILMDLVLTMADVPCAPFGWYVEACDLEWETKVGSVYLWFNEHTVSIRDIMESGVKLTADQFNRMRRWVDSVDEQVSTSGIVNVEVFAKFGAIPEGQRPMWSLGLLSLNQLDDGHNWMCEYMEWLAGEMFGDTDCDIQLGCVESWDFDAEREFMETYLEALFVDVSKVRELMHAESPESGECPSDESYFEWLDDLYADNDDHPVLSPLYDHVDDGIEFTKLLSYTMNSVQEAWMDGHLELRVTPSMPESVKAFVNQLTLPLTFPA